MIRNRIKDALRASIDTEDEALAKRSPTRASKRKTSVKAAIRQASREAETLVSKSATPAKPMEVTLSTDEAELLKTLRANLQTAGVSVTKADLLRLSVTLLAAIEPDALAQQCASLPKFKRAKK